MNKLKTYSIIITIITIILLIAIIFVLFIRTNKITRLEAQNIAYEYANVSENNVSNLRINKETFDNEYEIEFIDDKYKYEFEIDSITGRVINFEKDLINKTNPNKENNNDSHTNSDNNETNSIEMNEDDAKEIALNYVNLEKENVTFTKIKIDRESGKTVYELDFFDDKNEFEICVDIATEQIVKYSKEPLKLNTNSGNEYISSHKAKQLALNHANINENDIVWHKIELDVDYNIKTYEIEFYYNNLKYEYEIDAIDGNILKYEIDRD